MKKVAVLCDFDGTIAQDDVGNLLFRTFADASRTEPIVEAWKRGAISSRDCLEQEAALARVSHTELAHFVRERKIDPYFKDFVDFAKRRDMEVVIVSDGLDHYIEHMLLRAGLGELDYYANALQIVGQNLHVKFPHFDMKDCRDCGNCKTYHLECYRESGHFIVYVGNGLSDRCPSMQADLVFAKGDLLDFCRGKGVEHVEFRNFRDVEKELLRRFVLARSLPDTPDSEGVGGL